VDENYSICVVNNKAPLPSNNLFGKQSFLGKNDEKGIIRFRSAAFYQE